MMHLRPESISEAELILNKSGHIYHLDLAPGHLAGTVLTVGDPGRVPMVSRYFDTITHQAQHREFITHTGTIGGKSITVMSTGIGPDNIDIVFNELDALVNIDFTTRRVKEQKTSLNIIRLGTCGGLQPDLPLDSLVVSSFGIGMDNLLQYYRLDNRQEESLLLDEFIKHTGLGSQTRITPYIAESAIALRKHFGREYLNGITVTCPGFYGPQGRVLRLPLAYPYLIDSLSSFQWHDHRIANFEMETSAMYGLARLLGHKALSVNTVIANRINHTFSKDHVAAVDNMIRKTLEIVTTEILK